MSWLVLSYFLTVGCTFNQSAAIQDATGYHYWQAPTTGESIFGAELLAADHFFVSAKVRTDASYLRGVNFSPFLEEYLVTVGVRVSGFEIGFFDDCLHPELDTNSPRSSFFYSGDQGFYVTFKGSAKLF